MRVKESIAQALLGAAQFLESWPGIAAMWAALLIYCYL